jgi:hypothetical protein
LNRYRLNAAIILALVFGLIELIDWRNVTAMAVTAGVLVALVICAHAWDRKLDRSKRERELREREYHRAGGDWTGR